MEEKPMFGKMDLLYDVSRLILDAGRSPLFAL
jgi:hypothetical protein